MAPAEPGFPTLSYPFRAHELIDAIPGVCEVIRRTYQQYALLRDHGQMDPAGSVPQLILIQSLHKGQTDDQGRSVTENSVVHSLSLLTLPMPISTLQDIVDKGACHAALVSGEIRIGNLDGIVLQVSMTDHASSYWFQQSSRPNESGTEVAKAVKLPDNLVPPEATCPFFKPSSLKFH